MLRVLKHLCKELHYTPEQVGRLTLYQLRLLLTDFSDSRDETPFLSPRESFFLLGRLNKLPAYRVAARWNAVCESGE